MIKPIYSGTHHIAAPSYRSEQHGLHGPLFTWEDWHDGTFCNCRINGRRVKEETLRRQLSGIRTHGQHARIEMVNQADAPLTKVSLNLFTEDVIWMQETFGPGWTGELRQAVRKWRREAEKNND